jgi:hypothetical protein
MAAYTVNTISGGTVALGSSIKTCTGLTQPAGTAVSTSDTFYNDGKTFLEVVVGATATTIAFVQQNPNNQGEKFNPTLASISNTTRLVGPFDPALYNDANGNVTVTYSQTTNVTAKTYRLAEKFSGN